MTACATMRSYHIERFGDVEGLALHHSTIPTPGPSEVLVRVRASSLNNRDLDVLLGTSPYPCVPGVVPLVDGAGEVVAVGDAVTRVDVGDRVTTVYFPRWQGGPLRADHLELHRSAGANVDGVLCDFVVRDEDALVPVPAHLSFEEAATLPTAAVTAWNALHGTRPVGPGDIVLVIGSGGVAVFALQLARLAGADVVAVTSSAAKGRRLEELGAIVVLDDPDHPDWHVAVRGHTQGRGADCIVEVGGGRTFGRSLAALAVGGRMAVVGQLSPDGQVDLPRLRVPGAVLESTVVGSRASYEAMNRAIERHELRPVVDAVFPFGEAGDAYRWFADRRHVGKVVVCHV